MTEKEKIIAVDFDGVIHDYLNPIEGRRMGAPITGAKECLHQLHLNGYKIVVFSNRGNSDAGVKSITDFMEYYHLEYDEVTATKPNAIAIIDDRAIHFDNWSSIWLPLRLIEERQGYEPSTAN